MATGYKSLPFHRHTPARHKWDTRAISHCSHMSMGHRRTPYAQHTYPLHCAQNHSYIDMCSLRDNNWFDLDHNRRTFYHQHMTPRSRPHRRRTFHFHRRTCYRYSERTCHLHVECNRHCIDNGVRHSLDRLGRDNRWPRLDRDRMSQDMHCPTRTSAHFCRCTYQ